MIRQGGLDENEVSAIYYKQLLLESVSLSPKLLLDFGQNGASRKTSGEARKHHSQSGTESGAESQVGEDIDRGVQTGKEKEYLEANDKQVVVFSVEHELGDEVRCQGPDNIRKHADYIRDAEKQQHLGDSRF